MNQTANSRDREKVKNANKTRMLCVNYEVLFSGKSY